MSWCVLYIYESEEDATAKWDHLPDLVLAFSHKNPPPNNGSARNGGWMTSWPSRHNVPCAPHGKYSTFFGGLRVLGVDSIDKSRIAVDVASRSGLNGMTRKNPTSSAVQAQDISVHESTAGIPQRSFVTLVVAICFVPKPSCCHHHLLYLA
jgi:hypothetical protein